MKHSGPQFHQPPSERSQTSPPAAPDSAGLEREALTGGVGLRGLKGWQSFADTPRLLASVSSVVLLSYEEGASGAYSPILGEELGPRLVCAPLGARYVQETPAVLY